MDVVLVEVVLVEVVLVEVVLEVVVLVVVCDVVDELSSSSPSSPSPPSRGEMNIGSRRYTALPATSKDCKARTKAKAGSECDMLRPDFL